MAAAPSAVEGDDGSLAEAVAVAIGTMYGGGSGAGAGVGRAMEQSAAIAWLVEFQGTREAWRVWPRLLAPGAGRDANVTYYAANALAAKVAAEWSRLSGEECGALYEQLWELAGGLVATGGAATPPALGRLCRALAVLALQTPPVLPSLVDRLEALAPAAAGGGVTPALAMIVETARAVADVADDVQLAGAKKAAASDAVRAVAPRVLALLAGAIAADGAPLRTEGAITGVPAAAGGSLLVSALAAVAGWVVAGAVTPANLLVSYPDLAAFLPAVLVAGACASVASAAADAVTALLGVSAPPSSEPPAARCAAVTALVATLVSAAPAFRATLAAADADVLVPLANVLVAVAKFDAEWLAGDGSRTPPPGPVDAVCFPLTAAELDPDGSGNVHGAPAGLGVLLCEYALAVAGGRCLPAADAVLDFFTPLAALPVADRHPALRAPLARTLLRTLLAQVAYPLPGAARAVTADEFVAFRSASSGVADALADCFAMLQGAYVVEACTGVLASFEALALACHAAPPHVTLGLMLRPGGAGSAAAAALPPDTPTWQPLEAALYVLHAVGDDVSEMLEDADIDAGSGDAVAAEMVTALAYHTAVTLPPAEMAPELAAMAARWLGGLHRWLGVTLACSCDTLRAATLFVPAPAVPAPTPHGAVEAAITLLPTGDLVHAILEFLVGALAAVTHVGACARPPARERMAACLAFLGVEGRARAVAAAAAGDGDGGDDDDGGDGGDDDGDDGGVASGGGGGWSSSEVREDGKLDTDTIAVTTTAAAVALARIVRACRRHLTSDAAVKRLADGLAAACDAGLSAFAAAVVLKQLLGLAAALPPASAGPALHYFLDPPVARLAAMCDVVASRSVALTRAHEVAVAKEAVLVYKALQSAAAEAGGVTGMGDLMVSQLAAPDATPAAAAAVAAATAAAHTCPLAFVIEALWAPLTAALPAAVDQPALVAVITALLRRFIRVQPAVLQPVLPAALTLGVQLYVARLYPEALALAVAAVGDLPSRDPSRETLAYVHDALAAASDALVTAAATPADASVPGGATALAAHPEAATAWFSFARAVVDAMPDAAFVEDILQVCLPAVGYVVQLWDRAVATAAAEFMSTLLARRTSNPRYTPALQAAIASHGALIDCFNQCHPQSCPPTPPPPPHPHMQARRSCRRCWAHCWMTAAPTCLPPPSTLLCACWRRTATAARRRC